MRKVQWGQIYLKVVSEFEYRSNFLGLDSNLDNLTNQSFEIPSKSDISNIFCEIVKAWKFNYDFKLGSEQIVEENCCVVGLKVS